MRYDEIRDELRRFKEAGIDVTVGQFARYIETKSKEVVVKPYKFKILTGRATKHNLSAIA